MPNRLASVPTQHAGATSPYMGEHKMMVMPVSITITRLGRCGAFSAVAATLVSDSLAIRCEGLLALSHTWSLNTEGHMPDVCEQCGAELGVGRWPFCNGDPAKHVRVGRYFHDGFEPYV